MSRAEFLAKLAKDLDPRIPGTFLHGMNREIRKWSACDIVYKAAVLVISFAASAIALFCDGSDFWQKWLLYLGLIMTVTTLLVHGAKDTCQAKGSSPPRKVPWMEGRIWRLRSCVTAVIWVVTAATPPLTCCEAGQRMLLTILPVIGGAMAFLTQNSFDLKKRGGLAARLKVVDRLSEIMDEVAKQANKRDLDQAKGTEGGQLMQETELPMMSERRNLMREMLGGSPFPPIGTSTSVKNSADSPPKQ